MPSLPYRRYELALGFLCLNLLLGESCGLCSVISLRSASVSAGFTSSLVKVLKNPGVDDRSPGSARLPALRPTYSVAAARNEFESFQLVFSNHSSTPIEEMTVECSEVSFLGGGGKGGLSSDLYWEHYVFVSKPSGNALATPMWYPDALIPLRVLPTRTLQANETVVLWITIQVPEQSPPGVYRGRVRVTYTGNPSGLSLPFAVHVKDCSIPVTRHFHATGALYYHIVLDYYNKHFRKDKPPLQPYSPEWGEVKKRLYDFLLDYRFTPYDLPVAPDSPEGQRYLEDPRVNCFRLPWINDDLESFRSMVQRLKQHGSLRKAFYYQADEPSIPAYPDVLKLATELRSVDRRIRHLVTVPPVTKLYGHADIWCPNLGDTFNLGHLNFPRLNLRRKSGEETWWYTMTVPRYPYPTWLVDDEAVSPRIFFWMSSMYGFTGCVYSMVHGWSDDPYSYVQSFLDSNGDGLLIYPGEPFGSNEPFPSLRLMLIRDGLEDYEMLQALPPADRLSACRFLVQDLTRFSRSPERLQRVRLSLLEALAQRSSSSTSRRLPDLPPYRQPDWPACKITYSPLRMPTPPVIDGALGDNEWPADAWLSGFPKINGLRRAKAASRAQIGCDARNLYVAARCELPTVTSGDPLSQQWFALAIDPGRRKDRYYFFAVTAKGNAHTELRSAEGIDPAWQVPWTFKSQPQGTHFVVEMKIPFTSLGHTPQRGEVWGFNLLRRSREEFSAWQSNYGDVSLMPGLKFE